MMLAFNRCNFFHIRGLKLIKSVKFDQNTQIQKLRLSCERCNSNFAPPVSLEDILKENPSPSTSDSHESCDEFGNLQKSLEYSSKKNSKDVRVVKIKSRPVFKKTDNANVFGNLSDKSPIWYPDIKEEPKIDNDQSDDSVMVRNISRMYRVPEVYLERMRTLVQEKKLKDALDLFVEMKRNHVVPMHVHYTFMIGACGRAGYTEMAFKLFRQMTDRKMRPSSATLTGLFNSCGESPFPEYGLKKARLLKEKISIKNWEVTQMTYHAMIKAFGKCGDIQTAFQIVDEMAKADIKIDVETYSFLLMSCVSNKESGFTHAIEVWRKMKERKCKPNGFSCNILLRAARDCDIGPEEVSCLLLQHWSNYLKRPYGFKVKETVTKKPILQLQSAENKKSEENCSLDISNEMNKSLTSEASQKKDNEEVLVTVVDVKKTDLLIPTIYPSVLAERPEGRSDILDLGNIKTRSDRLALVGGAEGFLKEMKKDQAIPSIKTFTLLLECLPPNSEEEEKLISLFNEYNVTPDIGFCNILMKRRIFRHENSGAKQVLLLINQWGLTPDILTFGILALGCRHYTQALHFLNDLEKLGTCPNIEIAGALVSSACLVIDFEYLQHILTLMEDRDIQPNEKVLVKINKTLISAKENIIKMEHGKEVHQIFKKKNFSKSYKEFCEFYEQWLKRMKLEKEENVWSQYKTEIVDKYDGEPCKIMPLNK